MERPTENKTNGKSIPLTRKQTPACITHELQLASNSSIQSMKEEEAKNIVI